MPENNNIMSLEGQLVGMPLAGPESFSPQQLDYLKRALGVDETVLYSDASGALDSIPLSEALTNFERIKIVWKDWISIDCINVQEFDSESSNFMLTGTWAGASSSIIIFSIAMTPNAAKTTLTNKFARFITFSNTSSVSTADNTRILKVVGIHRIAGGN